MTIHVGAGLPLLYKRLFKLHKNVALVIIEEKKIMKNGKILASILQEYV